MGLFSSGQFVASVATFNRRGCWDFGRLDICPATKKAARHDTEPPFRWTSRGFRPP